MLPSLRHGLATIHPHIPVRFESLHDILLHGAFGGLSRPDRSSSLCTARAHPRHGTHFSFFLRFDIPLRASFSCDTLCHFNRFSERFIDNKEYFTHYHLTICRKWESALMRNGALRGMSNQRSCKNLVPSPGSEHAVGNVRRLASL